jgi:mono/diheme cytochrome c family protein
VAVALASWMVLLGAAGASAHGRDQAHLAAMKKQQERIPEEYRVMNRTPLTPQRSSLLRGRDLFASHCAACHGEKGEGDGPAAASLKAPPASFRDLAHSDLFAPGEKFWIIRDGFPAVGMPAFAAKLPPVDRWHLVNYILGMQKSARRQTQGSHDH